MLVIAMEDQSVIVTIIEKSDLLMQDLQQFEKR
jgi:hypothetical protein